MPRTSLARLTATAILLSMAAATPAVANDVANSGFEDPITFDGPPYVGFWEGFTGGAGSDAANSGVLPHSGAQHLLLDIIDSPNNFCGVLQDIPALTAGEVYLLRGWHMTPSTTFGGGVEIRIEWRDSVSNTEISRTPNITTEPSDTYTQFSLSAEAPTGADTARIVYALQSFSGGAVRSGTAYVDDVEFGLENQSTVESATWGSVKSLYR